MLGAGVSIYPKALKLLAGRRVRIFAHHDPKGQGMIAAEKWARQLHAVGAEVDTWGFAGIRKADGSPVKDLNDCTQIHPDDEGQMEGAWL